MFNAEFLHALADIPQRPPRDPRRLRALQLLCVDRLCELGSPAEIELLLDGAYRRKRWDVASVGEQSPVIGISMRSFMASRSSAAVNRLDDLLAEAANIHRLQPTAVLGFLIVVATDQPGRRGAATCAWDVERIGLEAGRVCGRPFPSGHPELFEAGCVLAVNFAQLTCSAVRAPGLTDFDEWLNCLTALQTGRQTGRRPCEGRRGRRMPASASLPE